MMFPQYRPIFQILNTVGAKMDRKIASTANIFAAAIPLKVLLAFLYFVTSMLDNVSSLCLFCDSFECSIVVHRACAEQV